MEILKITLLTVIQVCAFACYVPQIIKTLVTKSGEDIAVSSWSISLLSVICYIIYGIIVDDGFIVITCITEAILALISVIVLYKYRNAR